MLNSVTIDEIQKIWDNLPDEFRVYEKVYLIPITHLKSKGSRGILADLKDYAEFKTPDYHMFTGITKTIEDRRPNEFIVMNNLWYLDNKPVFYKAELAYFKTLEEAEDFLRNLELYPNGKTRFMNSRSARIVKYYEGGKNQCYNRNQYIFFIEKKKFFN